MTDEARYYERVGGEFASHGSVDHGKKEYGRSVDVAGETIKINTNTVEGHCRASKASVSRTGNLLDDAKRPRKAVQLKLPLWKGSFRKRNKP